jgi:hypothetical protein
LPDRQADGLSALINLIDNVVNREGQPVDLKDPRHVSDLHEIVDYDFCTAWFSVH